MSSDQDGRTTRISQLSAIAFELRSPSDSWKLRQEKMQEYSAVGNYIIRYSQMEKVVYSLHVRHSKAYRDLET